MDPLSTAISRVARQYRHAIANLLYRFIEAGPVQNNAEPSLGKTIRQYHAWRFNANLSGTNESLPPHCKTSSALVEHLITLAVHGTVPRLETPRSLIHVQPSGIGSQLEHFKHD
jgi:hypothetical protein